MTERTQADRAAVADALKEAANHRQLEADLISDLTGEVIHANTCLVCLMDWTCTTAVLAAEVVRLRQLLDPDVTTHSDAPGFAIDAPSRDAGLDDDGDREDG